MIKLFLEREVLFPELTIYIFIGLVLCLGVIGIRELVLWLKRKSKI